MTEIKTSKVNNKDIDAYANIIHEEMGFTHEEARTYLIDKNLNNMLKIEVNNKPIGFINYTHKDNIFYVNDIDILEKCRRKGYGSILLHNFEIDVKNRGGKKIWLHVNIDHKSAIQFYLKNNYKIGNRIENYYASNIHAFIVEKIL